MNCALDSKFGKQLRPGLALLIKAHLCARDVDRSAWDFAVEIKQLQSLGLGPCELRWLLCRGYLQHAIETTVPCQTGRSHLLTDCLQFADHSCFVLTDAGVSFAERCDARDSICGLVVGDPQTVVPLKDCEIPCWDTNRRELRFGRKLVKRFRVPAPNQQLVLIAFQEEDWPERIDDPLPPVEEIDSKRRLHTTIHSLNRNQKNHQIDLADNGPSDDWDQEIEFDLSAVFERPAAGNMNGDGIADLGLFVPWREGSPSAEAGEWFFSEACMEDPNDQGMGRGRQHGCGRSNWQYARGNRLR